VISFSQRQPQATNSLAELKALQLALQCLDDLNITRKEHVAIFSDSLFALGSMLGVTDCNDYLLLAARLRNMAKERPNLIFRYCPAHAGIPGNECADRRAKEAADFSHLDCIRNSEGSFAEVIAPAFVSLATPSSSERTLSLSKKPRHFSFLDPQRAKLLVKRLHIAQIAESLAKLGSRGWNRTSQIGWSTSKAVLRPVTITRKDLRANLTLRAGIPPAKKLVAKSCPFCGNGKPSSLRHFLGDCRDQFHNFYVARHNRVVEDIAHALQRIHGKDAIFFNTSSHRDGIPLELQELLPLDLRSKEPDIILRDPATNQFLVLECEVTARRTLEEGVALVKKEKQYADFCRLCGNKCEQIVLLFNADVAIPDYVLRIFDKLLSEMDSRKLKKKVLKSLYGSFRELRSMLIRFTSG